MKNQLCAKLYTLNASEGFTLIELLVVIAVIGILAVGGFVSFISYTQKVTLDNATSDVVNMLNTAKSRAQAQVIPSSCSSSGPFDGYKVHICGDTVGGTCLSDKTFVLYVVCGGNGSCSDLSNEKIPAVVNKSLPQSLSFGNGNTAVTTCVMFHRDGTIDLDNTNGVRISGAGNFSKNITIDAAGNISF